MTEPTTETTPSAEPDTEQKTPPASWQKHPTTGKQTWWDGTAWTDQVKPKRRVGMPVFWATAAGALVLGAIIGSAGSGGAVADVEVSAERIAELEAELVDERERSEAREGELAEQEAELASREAEVVAREAAVGEVEEQIAANTIPGSGVYLIGVDVNPGTYRSVDNSGCYWARLSGLGGSISDIIANDNVNGQSVVQIGANDVAFETNRCSDWEKID